MEEGDNFVSNDSDTGNDSPIETMECQNNKKQ